MTHKSILAIAAALLLGSTSAYAQQGQTTTWQSDNWQQNQQTGQQQGQQDWQRQGQQGGQTWQANPERFSTDTNDDDDDS